MAWTNKTIGSWGFVGITYGDRKNRSIGTLGFATEDVEVVAEVLPTHDLLVDAVAALVTALALKDYAKTAFTVSTTFPPRWEDSDAPTVFVFPDYSTAQPLMTGAASNRLGVTMLICERLADDKQLANRNTNLAAIRAAIMSSPRPTTDCYLSPEPFGESRIFDPEQVKAFEFITPVTVTYQNQVTL